MKRFLEELRGARNIEWLLAALAIMLLILSMRNESTSDIFAHTEQEQRLCTILNRIDGVGKIEIMISEEERGVLIVAEGAQDMNVCLRLQYAVQTLLGTDAARIEIVPYRNNGG